MTETKQRHDDVTNGNDATKQYVRIKPSTDGLNIENIQTQIRRLHEHALPEESTLLSRIFGDDTTQTIECLLVSRGGVNTTVEYYCRLVNGDLDTLERMLRNAYPDTVELTQDAVSIDAIADPEANRSNDEKFAQRAHRHVASVEYKGHATHRSDWQVGLKKYESTDRSDEDERPPLAAVVETMTGTSATVIYQALFQPLSNWTDTADKRRGMLKRDDGTMLDRMFDADAFESSQNGDRHSMNEGERRRFDAIENRETDRSFIGTVRASVVTSPSNTEKARRTAEELASVFGSIGTKDHRIEGTVLADGRHSRIQNVRLLDLKETGSNVLDDIREREMCARSYGGVATKFPGVRNKSMGIVIDAREISHFCVLGGRTVTTQGSRALDVIPGERTALGQPSDDLLETYRKPGFTVGKPETHDGQIGDTPIAIPLALQSHHIGLFGRTGAGKSNLLINAILANHEATDGLDVIIDPKGGDMTQKYLRAHYLRHGNLDDVYYFDSLEALPAFSFFDIRPMLETGIPRLSAVEHIVNHYVDITRQLMSGDNFEQAVRSPTVLRYIVKAHFDPVHGDDVCSHDDLLDTVHHMSRHQTAPAVSDETLETLLDGVARNAAKSFDNVMQGVRTRIEAIANDQRLGRIFGHAPDDTDDAFDFGDYLDEDAVVIFDAGSLQADPRRALTLVILSKLWGALKRRKQQSHTNADHPLVNVYLEEASTIATSDMLGDLLAQAREFDASVTLSTQLPKQFRQAGSTGDDGRDAQSEVLNNIGSLLLGNIPYDPQLSESLATRNMDPQEVGDRLRALEGGQWMLQLDAPYGKKKPRPFLARSLPLPPGDPNGNRPATDDELQAIESATDDMLDRTLDEIGLSLHEPSLAGTDTEDVDVEELQRVDSALGATRRLPECVEYDMSMHALKCAACQSRHNPHIAGMKRAINCCHDLDAVDRDDVPICDLDLKLTVEERTAAAQTDRQLCFIQAVHGAQQQRYDPLEYDIVRDSMVRLKEYVDIDAAAIQELIESDLLRHDTDHPFRLYSVTADGRDVIGESHRAGLDHGDGAGDLTESSQHIFSVEVARRYLEAEYVDDAESAVVEARPYYDVPDDDDEHRLDLVGLDADGEVVVAVEAERSNHDRRSAVPTDFDKISDIGCEEAIWVVMSRSGGHDVLAALNDPKDGDPRVEKTYSSGTPPQQFSIETSGLTDIYPVEHLRGKLGHEEE